MEKSETEKQKKKRKPSHSQPRRKRSVYQYLLFVVVVVVVIPFVILVLLSRSLPVVSQIRGHIAGPLLSPPYYGTCLHFIATIIQHFLPSLTRVELKLLQKFNYPVTIDPLGAQQYQ